MRNITFSNFITTNIALLLIFHISKSFSAISFPHEFQCLNKKGNVPELPKAYSTDVKLNFATEEQTVELKYSKSSKEKSELIELRKSDRHVKYIIREDEGSTLYIEYKDNKQPSCEVIKSIYIKDFLKKEDGGEKYILLKTLEVMLSPFQYNIYSTGPSPVEIGVPMIQYDGCLREPKMNISMTFAVQNWRRPYTTSSLGKVNVPETVVTRIDDDTIIGFYSNFDPSEPDSSLFQPSSDIFCKGFRTKKTPPKMPNIFSYGAEIINYKSIKQDIVPMITQRKVYYDYKDNISRVDFNDLLAFNSSSFYGTTAQKKSIIHDFNSGVQYIIDSVTGKCSIDTFQETFSVISFEKTKDNKMFTGAEYFWVDDVETSYNGQFNLRGVTADVYTALRIDPRTKNPYIISWFFSTERIQVAENENVGKNVLLSMSVRPETEFRKEEKAEIHFFDFVSEEPDVFNFDLTKCYNESSSKTLVFTFPAYDPLRGSEKLIGTLLNTQIQDITGVRKHRIFTKEVIFSGKYMYSEFSLLDDSPVNARSSSKAISLDEALQKLQDSVSKGSFEVKVPIEDTLVSLKPEPNGLNVFAGDRPRISNDEGYKEGSVIAITIGMLFLGFLLGGVAINLIINRKYGVSLFQRNRFGGKGNQHTLSENTF